MLSHFRISATLIFAILLAISATSLAFAQGSAPPRAPSDFNKPYAGVNPATGNRPLLVILMRPRDDKVIAQNRIDLFGLTKEGYVQQVVYGLRKKEKQYVGFEPAGSYQHGATTAMPKSVRFRSAPAVSSHPEGTLQSVFGIGLDGKAYQSFALRESDTPFDWRPWTALPAAPVELTGTPAALNYTRGSDGGSVQLVLARGEDGVLYAIEYLRGGGGWRSWNALPGDQAFTDGPAAVLDSQGRALNVFAVGKDGVVYRSVKDTSANGSWTAWSALPTDIRILSGLSAASPRSGQIHLAGRGRDGKMHVIEEFGQGWGPWTRLPPQNDLVHGATLMTTADGEGVIAYATARDGALHYSWNMPQFPGLPWQHWQPVDTRGGMPIRVFSAVAATPALAFIPTQQAVREMIFGSAPSVRDFYLRNSFGKFTFSEALVTDWLTAEDDTKTSGRDESAFSYIHGPAEGEKAAYVIRAAEEQAGIDYKKYDANSDGLVTEDELAIYWIYPGGSDARARGTEPKTVRVKSLPPNGGVKLRYLVRGGSRTGFATVAHELGHQVFGLPDLYETDDKKFVGVGVFSTMGNEGAGNFFDPWTRMKLGWMNPSVVQDDRVVTLLDSKKHDDAVILADKDRDYREYFIVENRQPDPVYEAGLNSRGLAVWHIYEHYDDPFEENWGRKTVQLKWAGGEPSDTNTDANDHALFNKDDGRAYYNLTESSSPANSKWRNGADSNIDIVDIPAASDAMTVWFDFN